MVSRPISLPPYSDMASVRHDQRYSAYEESAKFSHRLRLACTYPYSGPLTLLGYDGVRRSTLA